MKLLKIVFSLSLVTYSVLAKAQSGIGTIAPDPTVALHVKTSSAAQDALLLEGLRIGTTETNIVVSDATGKLRYRPAADLNLAEWRDNVTSTFIYAFRAKTEGSNADVVITDTGNLGIGTTAPVGGLDVYRKGIVSGNSPMVGTYSPLEPLRLTGSTSDVVFGVNDGTGRFNIKWNATYGSGEQFLSTGDYATKMLMHGDPTPGASLFRIYQSTVPGTAAANIGWTTRFQITNEGNVGIGNTTPTNTLDVNGTARIRTMPNGLVSDDPLTTDRVVVTDNTGVLKKVTPDVFFASVGEWANHSSNQYIYARRAKNDAPFHDVVVSTEGEIGLGLTNPEDKIHLNNGGMQINGDWGLGFNSERPLAGVGTRDGSRIYSDRNAFGTNLDALVIEKTDVNQSTVDGGILFSTRGSNQTRDDRMTIRGNGRVGINVMAPQDLLHIFGDALVQTGGLGNAATGGLIRTGDRYTNNITWLSNGLQASDETDFVYFGGKREGANRMDGVIVFGDDPSDNFRIMHGAASGTTNEALFISGATRNVGIGSINPLAKLHVGGNARIDIIPIGDVNNVGVDDELVTADANGNLRKVPASSIFQSFQDDDWTIVGNNIYNKNAGNVGIGQTNPQYKLDINGSVRLGLTNYFQFGNNSNNRLTVLSDNDVVVTNNARFKFQNRNATQELLVIDGGVGSVGIGTNTPNASFGLDFATSGRFRENVPLYFGNQSASGNRNYIYNLNDNDFRIRAQTLFNVRNRNDNLDVFTVHAQNERVGIKTNNPSVELDVEGRVRVGNLPAGVSGDLLVSTDVNGNLRKIPQASFDGPWDRNTGSGGRTFLRNVNDKVGIGLIAPSSPLHIYEPTGTSAGNNQGTILLEHGNSGGESSIVFKSRATGSDYGYISYADDASANGSTSQNSLLEIGVQNNGVGNNQDDIAIMPSGRLGINTRGPQRMLHVEGDARITNLPTVTNSTDFAVTVDASGDLRKQTITSIKDNLGDHQMTQNLVTNTNVISYAGTNAGLKLTNQNSVVLSNRLQVGNFTGSWVDDVISGISGNGFAGNDGAIFAPVYTGSENSDLRLYILDNSNDAFSIWGNPCGASDCGNINASSRVIQFQANGAVRVDQLATGGASQMVLADASGRLVLGGVPPTSTGPSAADNLGNHIATQNIRLNNRWLTNDGTNGDGLSITDDGQIQFSQQRILRWGTNIYASPFISGASDANGDGGNTDIEIDAQDDILIRARGSNGDIMLIADNDVQVSASDAIELRAGTDNNNDNITFYTDNTVERMSVRNTGNVRVNNLAGSGNRIVVADPNGDLQVMSGSSTGLWDRDLVNNETYLTNSADEVGIGTADPLTQLHLSQATAVGSSTAVEMRLQNRTNHGSTSLTFLENTGTNVGMRIIYDGGDDRLKFQDANNTDFMTIRRSGGDVGVGTINPQTQLHVVRNGVVGNAGSGLTNPARLRIQNEVAEGSAAIELMEGAGGINNNNGMSLRYHSTADGIANGFEIVRGDASSSNIADIHFRVERNNGAVTVRNLSTGGSQEMVVSNNLGQLTTRPFDAALWNRAGSFTTLANTADQVGIGTTTPAATLDVNGSVNVRGLGAGAGTDNFVVADPVTGRLKFLPPSTFTNYWARAGAGELVLAMNSDRIGLGVVPSGGVKLHIGTGTVRMDDLAGAGTRMVVADALGSLSTQDLSSFTNYWSRNIATGDVTLVTNSDQVGIGVAVPQAKLHVNGLVRFNSLANPGGYMVVASTNGELSTQAIAPSLWDRGGTNTFLANGGDRIGIGTSTPLQKVHIVGLNNTIRIEQMPVGSASDNIVVRDANGDLKQVTASTFDSPWARDAVNAQIYQKNLGDFVGIGTNQPLSPLHISRAGGTGLTSPVELRIQNTTNGGAAQIRLRDRASTNTNADNYNSMLVRYVGNTNNFQIANGSDSTFFNMRRQNGYIFLGSRFPTIQPTERLHVDGNIRMGDGFRVQFEESNSYLSDIGGVAGDDDLILRSADILYLRGGANNGLRVNGNGTLVFDNLPIGNANSDELVTYNGGNIRRVPISAIESPWELNGTTVRLDDNNNNVGIGVSTASAKLDVNGSTRLRGLGGSGTQMVITDNNGNLSTQAIPSFTNYWARTGTQVTLANAGDQVAIGTTPAALARLTVGGLTQINTLAGTGTRMVTADANGMLFAAAMPSSLWTKSGIDVSLAAPGDEVGIGTAAPSAKLHVVGTIRFEALASGASSDNIVSIDGSGIVRQTTAAAMIGFSRSGTTVSLANANDDLIVDATNITIDAASMTIRNAASVNVAVFDGVNRRMGIGNLPSAASATVDIQAAGADVPLRVRAMPDAPASTTYRSMLIATNGNVLKSTAAFDQTGSPIVVSDERLKTNVRPLNKVLDGIGQLTPVSYQYKNDTGLEGLDTAMHYGFMAQQLAKAFPHAVSNVDGYLHLKERELTGILFAATHELRNENISLTARTGKLEAELAELKAKNTDLARDLHSLTAETRELQKNMSTVLRHLEAGKRIQASER